MQRPLRAESQPRTRKMVVNDGYMHADETGSNPRIDAIVARREAGQAQRDIFADVPAPVQPLPQQNWRTAPRPRGSLRERFNRKWIPEPNSGCFLWFGATNRSGYGNIGIGKSRTRLATHVSLELAGRPVPPGMFACHHCDNPSCVNPDHLFIGTHLENAKDMCRKGRQGPRGKRPSLEASSNLTDEQVGQIRFLLVESVPQDVIAAQFRVKVKVINAINRGMAWVHLPWPEEALAAKRDAIIWINLAGERLKLSDALSAIGRSRPALHNLQKQHGWTPQQAFDYWIKKRDTSKCGLKKVIRLTEEHVKQIRADLARGDSAKAIGRRYGISATNVGNVRHGRTWAQMQPGDE